MPCYESDDEAYERLMLEEPRCPARVAVRLPHDSMPSTITVQCQKNESECDGDHAFEQIDGARYGVPYYPEVRS